uniref:C2H2-type domain-containing protein n=1 Tax=Eptatretus burgeri TaxID=7764 RepID=A0A8C4RB23_EPTBU
MDEAKTFPAWLQARGLKRETAEAVVTELDMQSKGLFIACAESPSMRMELFSLAKQRLPFSMYAELKFFVESLWKLQSADGGRPVLVDVLYSMLNAISLELASCAKKLMSLDSTDESQGERRIELGEEGIRIVDVCSLLQQRDEITSPPSASDDCGEETAAAFLASDVDAEMEEIVCLHSSPAECDVSTQTGEGIQQRDDYDDNDDVADDGDGDDKFLEATLPEIALDGDLHIENTSLDGPTLPGLDEDLEVPSECIDESNLQGELDPVPMDEKHFVDHITIPSSSQEPLSNVFVKQESCFTPEKEPTFETTSTVVEPSEPASLYSCSRCAQLFLTEDALLLHMERLHRRGRMYKCSVCGRTFAELRMLQKHMAVHKGALPHKCPICRKGFARVSNMQLHMKVHFGEKPNKCFVCGNVFHNVYALQIHMRIHTGERPYNCSVCGKAFTQLGHVTSHMRIHTGERPYKCSVCGKGFSQLTNVKSHMRIHTGERPYKCVVCGKGFSQKASIKSHMNSHQPLKENGPLCQLSPPLDTFSDIGRERHLDAEN